MKKTLRFQFYIFIVVLLMIFLMAMSFLPVTISRNAVFDEKKNSLSSQGNAAASALSRLDRMNEESISEVLGLLDLSGFGRIMVSDNSGNSLYDSGEEALSDQDREDVATALTGKTVFRSSLSGEMFRSRYVTPLSTGTSIKGCLLLDETDSERALMILEVQNRIRNITVGLCIGAFILAMIFGSSILRRFRDLKNSMRTVAEGDYAHRLKVRGNDELTEIGNEFNQLTEKLESTESQRRRFVSDASHELKTPLASIRLLTDSIVQNEGMDPDTMRDFVSDIGTEAVRLQHTTEKLLDLSRLDDDIRVAREPVDVRQVVVDAYVFAKPLADERNVKIKCELEEGCIVMATVDDMYHIVFNLLENAVKYNVEDGSVTVSLAAKEESVILTVSDTGIGVPEEDRINIFSRFYRVDKARSREQGGSGLGLSIVHDAVQLYGGEITVGPNRPKGSVFQVKFPQAQDEETGI